MSGYIVVLVTCPARAQAQRIAGALIKEKLCACVYIFPSVQSLFWWEGKIDSAREVLMVIKTKRALYKALVSMVEKKHSYATPEIIALPVLYGNKNYLRWIDESVKKSSPPRRK